MSILNFSCWLAFFKITAFSTFSFCFIRGAIFSNHISSFHKIWINLWPSTFTAFIHEITLKNLLWWNHWNVFTIFQFQSGLNSLWKSNSITRSTSSLISYGICKIISVNPSVIIWFRNIWIWNLLRIFIICLPFLSLLQSIFEIVIVHFSKLLSSCSFIFICINLGKISLFIITNFTFTIILMTFLKFTCACFPS